MLSLLVFFPVIFGGGLFLSPLRWLRHLALIGSLIYTALIAILFFLFDTTNPHLQLVERFPLIPRLGVQYFLGIDGLSFWYVILSAFLLPLAVLSSWKKSSPLYFFLLFAIASTVTGSFLSFDGILFYLFFELSLLPLFFLIYLWGGEQRVYAAFKFLIYTFLSSLFLLVSFISLMLIHKNSFNELSFSLLDFYNLDLVFVKGTFFSAQSLLFCAMSFAFAVKTPLVPFHSWLPLAHVQAPAAASVYLAALLLKMGTYGWFRMVVPLFPEASAVYGPVLLFLAVFGLIYTSLVAFAQKDMKKIIAYSSVAHMAYVLLGLFSFNGYGLAGGFYQTLTHAVSSAGLFFLVGVLYDRTHNRDITAYGGLAKSMPWFGVLFFILTLSAIAFPFTGGFVSEFLALLGSYLSGEPWVWFAVLGLVLSALYMLRLYQRVFFMKESALSQKQNDVTFIELSFLVPLAVLVWIMGIFPNEFLKYSQASLTHFQKHRYNYYLSAGPLSEKEIQPKTARSSQSPKKKESSEINPTSTQNLLSEKEVLNSSSKKHSTETAPATDKHFEEEKSSKQLQSEEASAKIIPPQNPSKETEILKQNTQKKKPVKITQPLPHTNEIPKDSYKKEPAGKDIPSNNLENQKGAPL